jgi:hypothetical protein
LGGREEIMKMLTRSLAALLILAATVACAGAPRPAATRTAPARPSDAPPTNTAQPVLAVSSPAASAVSPSLALAARMTTGRAAHTATLLPDGRVLIAGGFRQEGTAEIAIASAELFDPTTDSFEPTRDMVEAHVGHTATLLPDGRVLIVGGFNAAGRTAAAELYDPRTGGFSQVAELAAPRASFTATLLPDGRVLIAGGETANRRSQPMAEIYDPVTGTFSAGASLNAGRAAHTATLLADGRVLFVGGAAADGTVLASAEIFDPVTGTFTLTGSLTQARHKHAAVLLADGQVLVVGGSDHNDWQGQYASAEIYDAARGGFMPVADLTGERFKLADAVLRLDDGNVLVAGGNRQVEIFDWRSQRFIADGQLDASYYYSVLTRLPNGRVLITGGYDASIRPSDKAWIYG